MNEKVTCILVAAFFALILLVATSPLAFGILFMMLSGGDGCFLELS